MGAPQSFVPRLVSAKLILFLVLGFALVLNCTGCVVRAVQTEAFFAAPRDIPESHPPEQVEFIKQTKNYCGPATLTMALNAAGKKVTLDEIATQVYTPGKEGALQADMVSAVRRQGMLGVQIQGLPSLMHEVAAGHPVVIFENLLFNWYSKWHYALVVGYDLPEQKIILHSGEEAYKRWDIDRMERSWMYSDYWALVVLPPSELAVSGSELAHTTAAAGLEQIGKVKEAEQVYGNILKRWPSSLGAMIGVGNISYARADYKSAVAVLTRATEAYPDSAMAWNNLATAQGAAKLMSAARKSATRALELAGPNEKAAYRESLRDFL